MTLETKTPSTVANRSGALQLRGAAPRIALIGCGAIAESYHLPALVQHRAKLGGITLVDTDLGRARQLAQRFEIEDSSDNFEAVADAIDAAIVAVPPALHHPICMNLLSRGIHVFCEKPLAETAVDAHAMVAEAEERGVVLCVNQTRRFFPAQQQVRRLIEEGEIGELLSIAHYEGHPFAWDAVSAFHFRAASRGVLLDKGIHVLDSLCWWLGARPEVVSSENDSFGGPEGTAQIHLRHQTCTIEMRLSWLTRLENRFVVTGDRGTISGSIDHWDRLTVTNRSGRMRQWKAKCAEEGYNDFGSQAVGDFIGALNGEAPLAPGRDVLPAMDVLDECYETATRLSLPWLERFEVPHAR